MQQMQPFGIVIAPDLKPLARFPKPNLAIDDGHAQMTALLQQQNEKLNSYGWVDRSNNVVRIPIDRAMDLFLQQSLQTATSPQARPDGSELQLIQERPAQR